MTTPSRFFATFSLRQLVNIGQPDPSTSEQAGSYGLGVGSIGGSTGVSTPRSTSGEAHCHKSESLSLPVSFSGDDKFDEAAFTRSLKTNLEKQIIDKTAVITQRGDLEGSFYSSEFYFEYSQEDLRGRIVLSGNLSGTTYRLKADIEERSPRGGFNIDVRSDGGLSVGDAFRMMKPEGDYYVLALAHDHPLARDDKLLHVGRELIRTSVERIRQGMTSERMKDLKSVEVWSLAKLPSHVQGLLAENDVEHQFEVPEEYRGYDKVFFLNELAVKMYSEGGITLETLRKISGDEMPRGCTNRKIRGPYLPIGD